MKRAILPALVLALCVSIPVFSQDDQENETEALQAELATLKEKVDQQSTRIEQLEGYVAKTKSQAIALHEKLKFAEKKGFTYPAPHTDARKALLFGLQDYAAVAGGGSAAKRK
jgi:septal ring factor EnvC (AmiA/AmiB activator)